MQPLAAITDITNFELDTVIVWDDGDRAVAHAYQNGRVKRTMPLAAAPLAEQINELRAAFRVADGQVYSFGGMRAAPPSPIPSMQPAGAVGPRRWS
jgi:hypothetical protein